MVLLTVLTIITVSVRRAVGSYTKIDCFAFLFCGRFYVFINEKKTKKMF